MNTLPPGKFRPGSKRSAEKELGMELSKAKSKLSERKTVHEWLNRLGVPQKESGAWICLLRRLRIALFESFKTRPELIEAVCRIQIEHEKEPASEQQSKVCFMLEALKVKFSSQVRNPEDERETGEFSELALLRSEIARLEKENEELKSHQPTPDTKG